MKETKSTNSLNVNCKSPVSNININTLFSFLKSASDIILYLYFHSYSPDPSLSYMRKAHLSLSSAEPAVVRLVATTNSWMLLGITVICSLFQCSYPKAYLSIAISVKEAEHLVDENFCVPVNEFIHYMILLSLSS